MSSSTAPQGIARAQMTSGLGWSPDYRDSDAPATSAHPENIVIREKALWPTALSLENKLSYNKLSYPGRSQRPKGVRRPDDASRQIIRLWYLPDLLDTHAARLVRGYIGIGHAIPGAHALSCALAADAYSSLEAIASPATDSSGTGPMQQEMRVLCRKFWRTAARFGPLEYLVSIGYLFESLLHHHLELLAVDERPQWNPQRVACGRELLCFILEQDSANAAVVQTWLDRAALNCIPLFEHARQCLKSWAEAGELKNGPQFLNPYPELFSGLAQYGIDTPAIALVARH